LCVVRVSFSCTINSLSYFSRTNVNAIPLMFNSSSGWWYYERVTLARHEGPSTDPDSRDNFVSANPGELRKKTYLYPLCSTPETDLADFGEGIGIYFYTLRILAIVFCVAGILSLPNMFFFASSQWDAQKDVRYHFLQASALCSRQIWKVCNRTGLISQAKSCSPTTFYIF
jgi:hypothetical protein